MRGPPSAHDYFFFFFLLAFVIFLLLILYGGWHFYLGVSRIITGGTAAYRENDLYLLSASVQSLAAVFALVITISIVIIQLPREAMTTHEAVLVQLRNYKFWGTVLFSLFTLLWNFILLGRIKGSPMGYNVYIDLGLLFTLSSLVLFIPYLLSALERLKPEVSIDVLEGRIK